jgi:3-dehydroquinate dehydratase/shikimate dehydrogenase
VSASAPECLVVIGRTRHKMVQVEIQEAAKRGARFLELRLDFLAKAPDFKRLLANKPGPIVATVRRPADGGRWAGSEEARHMLLRQATVAGFDWVDLETDIADSMRRFGNVKRIVSYHNRDEVPADLEKIYESMCKQDADVVKVAVRAQQPGDNLRVLDLYRNAPKPTVAFCMGDVGLPSRILSLKYGAPFVYAAFNKERGIAPGLPSFDEMKRVYRFEDVNADTAVYGVVGDPVGHSLSPLVHNSAFREEKVNAVYLPFRVPRGELEGFVRDFARVPVRGYSVTIPHKEAAAELAGEKEEAVDRTGAANTLVFGRDGGFGAFNTDYQAAIETLQTNLPRRPEEQPPTVSSRTVLLLGAGGVARAVAHALHRQGANVTLVNRTAERAHRLAGEVGCRQIDWGARHSVICDTVVNCTSVGMHPNVDQSPIHPSFLKPGLVVFETIYTPEQTLLVKDARSRGCHVITGVEMFVRQAAVQFRLFTGKEPPVELMAKVVRRALSPVTMPDDA